MKILSNDYPTNTPGPKRLAQGGPAVFAKGLSSYAESNNHLWVGLITAVSTEAKNTRLYDLGGNGKKHYYKLSIPYGKIRKITKAEGRTDPTEILSKEIDRTSTLIKEVKADVVFINGFSLYAWILLKAAEKAKAPIVIQHAGMFGKELDIYRDRFTPEGIRLMKKMEAESSDLSEIEIFLNEWSRDYYSKNVHPADADSSIIIPLPFRGDVPEDLQRNKNDHVVKLGCIARWDRIKNHKAILRLAKEIKDEDLPWEINSVTKIPETPTSKEFKDRYRAHINVLPSMGRADILSFIKSMDMMLVPSLFDVSPFVVLESIFCGTPVLISEGVGFSTTFKDYGGEKYVVDFEDPKAIIKKINDLKDKKIPTELVRHIKERHDPEKVFDEYLAIFEKISNKNKK